MGMMTTTWYWGQIGMAERAIRRVGVRNFSPLPTVRPSPSSRSPGASVGPIDTSDAIGTIGINDNDAITMIGVAPIGGRSPSSDDWIDLCRQIVCTESARRVEVTMKFLITLLEDWRDSSTTEYVIRVAST